MLSTKEKINVLKSAGKMLGMYPKFEYNSKKSELTFKIANCPFKEIASTNHTVICRMHNAFIKGMLATLFTDEVKLIEKENMFQGCKHCSYVAKI